ncbi:MAG TPA: hypothetical protein VFE47_23145 [Tepidisphaeraceae bacterium]|jgi:hypothetical protein|nr:hypothetical protein [Tepidisphaeraceae bacterium]
MRSLLLSAAGAALCVNSICTAQTTRPSAPLSPPAATQPSVTTQPPATQASATTQPAATQASATTKPSIDSFLPRLGSDSWKQRQEAVQELVRMGEDARPMIHELLSRNIADGETRTRLEAALSQIDENRLIGASFITIHLKNATPKAVFEELSRQCYADLQPFPQNLFDQGDQPKVSIDIDRQPFWTAMNTIADKTGIDLQQYNEGVRLMHGGFRMNSPFSTIQGPFLVVATQISRSQTEMLANGGGSSSDFSIQMMAYSEPKLHVLSSSAGVKLEIAVDDAGNSLMPTSEGNRGYYGGSGGCWNLFAQLKYPDHPGKKIARIKGTSRFLIQTKSQRIEIPDIKNVKEMTRIVGDMPVVFHEMKKTNEIWELRLSGNPQALGNNRWAQFNQSVQTNLQVLDDKGQMLEHRGMSSRGDNNGIEFTLMFSPSLRPDGRNSSDPAKLVWEVPTASKEIEVPFDFKDLPMPR